MHQALIAEVPIFISGESITVAGTKPQTLPHEFIKANIIKWTFRGLYYERDAESSQRAPL